MTAIINASPREIHLVEATGGRTNGVFTADLTWSLTVTKSNDWTQMLPDRVVLLFADQLPFEGSRYPGLPLCTCRGVSTSRVSDGLYTFTAKFSDENSDQESETPGTDENPLLDRPIILPNAGIKTIAIHQDRDRQAILNAAGDPVIEEADHNTIGFSVSANVKSIPWYILEFADSTNHAPIVVRGLEIPRNAARFILPSDWHSEDKSRNDIQYVVFKFELLIDQRYLHYGRPLNAGYRERVPRYLLDEEGEPTEEQARRVVYLMDEDGTPSLDVNGERIQARDDDGNLLFGDLLFDVVEITEEDGSQPSKEQPLDFDGKRIDNPTPETSTFLTVKKYHEIDYSILPGIEVPS